MTNKKFLIGMAVLLSASLFFLGCSDGGGEEPTEPQPSAVSGKALALDSHVVTPAQGAEAGDGVIGAAQYTGAVTWTPAIPTDGKFAASTEYTAEVALEAKDGYTFNGVLANSFTYEGADVIVTHPAGTGKTITVTVAFPVTLKADGSKNAVNALDLTALITKPAKNAAPQTAFAGPAQYSGEITWTKADDSALEGATFGANTEYKAAVTLTAKTGWTFEGVAAGAFSYSAVDAKSYTNSAGTAAETLLVTIEFKATAGTAADPATVNATELDGAIVKPATGAQAVTVFASPDAAQYTATGATAVAWTPVLVDNTFAANTAYTATVTLAAGAEYTFAELAADAFSYTGATVTFVAATGVVTVVFANTDTVVSGTALDLANAFAVPVTGGTPVAAFTSPGGAQYTGPATVAWAGALADGKFAADAEYTATVTLAAAAGYTFATLTDASWTVPAGATAAFDAATGVLAVTFKTAAVVSDTVLTALVKKPVKNDVPTVADGAQYTVSAVWTDIADKAVGTQFGAATGYKAVVTLTPVAGKFTFTGFDGTFTYAGASSIAQELKDNGTAVVTLTFPDTDAPETTAEVTLDPLVVTPGSGIALTKEGASVTLTVSSSAADFPVKNGSALWYVDGQKVDADKQTSTLKLTLKPADYAVRESAHHVTVTAEVDKILYSKTVEFTVAAKSN